MNLPPVIVSRRSKGTRRPELTLSPGPAHLAQPGAGSYLELYGCPWALALHRDGPQLYQLTAGEWVPRADPGGALVGLVRGVRWVGLAWDQAARPVICWEQSGAVYVRQWDAQTAQYVTRGPWPGLCPLLTVDAVSGAPLADSDVLLMYLDGVQVVARVQREQYATPHALADVGAGAVLDQVVSVWPRWQVRGMLADGAPLTLGADLYPVRWADSSSATAQPQAGVYSSAIVGTTQGPDSSSASAQPQAGTYAPAVTMLTGTPDSSRASAQPQAGSYAAALITRTGTDSSSTSAQPQAGSYALGAVYGRTASGTAAATAQPIAGSYTL